MLFSAPARPVFGSFRLSRRQLVSLPSPLPPSLSVCLCLFVCLFVSVCFFRRSFNRAESASITKVAITVHVRDCPGFSNGSLSAIRELAKQDRIIHCRLKSDDGDGILPASILENGTNSFRRELSERSEAPPRRKTPRRQSTPRRPRKEGKGRKTPPPSPALLPVLSECCSIRGGGEEIARNDPRYRVG